MDQNCPLLTSSDFFQVLFKANWIRQKNKIIPCNNILIKSHEGCLFWPTVHFFGIKTSFPVSFHHTRKKKRKRKNNKKNMHKKSYPQIRFVIISMKKHALAVGYFKVCRRSLSWPLFINFPYWMLHGGYEDPSWLL